MIKQIARMSSTLKAEAITAVAQIEVDGYTVSGNQILDNDDGSIYGILFYRNGDEVIAVPDFYISEDNVSLIGSKGNDYTLNGETLVAGFNV